MTSKFNRDVSLNLPNLPSYIAILTKMQHAVNLSMLLMNPQGAINLLYFNTMQIPSDFRKPLACKTPTATAELPTTCHG